MQCLLFHFSFKAQFLQEANTDFVYPLVSEAHLNEQWTKLFSLLTKAKILNLQLILT